MKEMRDYNIPFVGLKQGKHQFEFEIDEKFFEAFEYTEFNEVALRVAISLLRQSTMLEFDLVANGTVNINCDLTNEPFDMPVTDKLHLIVKFGDEYNDENEDILIIPHGEHQVNLAQYIYEMVVLAMPAKRVHPKVADGTIGSAMLKKLEELQPKEVEETNETDPRWDALKKLITDK